MYECANCNTTFSHHPRACTADGCPYGSKYGANWGAIHRGLEEFSAQVENSWRASDYPRDMRSSREQFRHAHLHATKALGKIAALIDHQDHDRLDDLEAVALCADLSKFIADLVRCAAKMAETAPGQRIAFWAACMERAKQLAERWGH